MLFFARSSDSSSPIETGRVAASLGLFAGRPADNCQAGGDFFARLRSPRAAPRGNWRPSRSPAGWPVLLSGWIDNAEDLARQLGITSAPDSEYVYGAAVERWGDEADLRVIGNYASIVCLPDGEVRLSRAPWNGRSLFYHHGERGVIASSITRPMFAAGIAKRLRPTALDGVLAMDLPPGDESYFEGIDQVAVGTVVRIGKGTFRKSAYYDPLAIADVRFARDEDYVDAANALLEDAVRAALRDAARPGVTLSGGLDSSIVCDEVLRQRPHGVTSFTFCPLDEWDGIVHPHKFGDDRPYVEAFAADHPTLETVFVDNRDIGFDHRQNERFLATDSFYAASVSGGVYEGLYEAAREKGCDWLLFSGAGNLTYSNMAPWAHPEFLRTGRWDQLWQLAANRVGDPRPMWRRIAALALMPNLPAPVRDAIRRARHGAGGGDPFGNALLNRDARLGGYADGRAGAHTIYSFGELPSRESFIARSYAQAGRAAEGWEGAEQIYGIRLRDVPDYRPLIEFCLGLPTDQMVRDGKSRWLARRMGQGRIPEIMRTNRLYGEHNVDWHARLTPRLPELRRRVERLADHPELGPLIDTEKALRLLDDWPENTSLDPRVITPLFFTIPAMISAARYCDFVTGRNSE